MRKHPTPRAGNKKKALSPTWALPAALGLALLGQFLLIQQDKPWTAWAGSAVFLAAGFFLLKAVPAPAKPVSASSSLLRWEPLFLSLIFLLALGLRLYRLDQFPPGLFTDIAKQGYGALRILHEGWNPFREPDQYLGGTLASFFYWLALSFRLTSPSAYHLFLTSVFLALLAFPFFYFCARKLAGPRAALLALFFLAVMRWHVTYSRDGHPAIEIPLYLFGALAAWLWTLESKNQWGFFLLALFLAAGCYSYEAFLPFLLALAILGWYEVPRHKSMFRGNAFSILASGAAFLALTAPVWNLHWRRGSFGAVYDHPSLFSQIHQEGFGFLGRHLAGTFLMFSREGDGWFFHNIPGHRLLDDATGILLVLGVVFAVARRKERRYFYGLVGLGCMLLPNFFSTLPLHASRSIGAAGFCAFLAACGLDEILGKISRPGSPQPLKRFFPPLMLAGVLLFSALQNSEDYFGEQAKDLAAWKGYGWEATLVGDRIQAQGDGSEFYLSPRFFNHYAVLFLGYSQGSHMHELAFPEGLNLPGRPPERGAFFALEEGRTGALGLIQALYPGGETEVARDPSGNPLVYFYRVSAEKTGQGKAAAEKFLRSSFGLKGEYRRSGELNGPPTLTHDDPLLNFTFRNDFPLRPSPSLSVHWDGILSAPASGWYVFVALTTDSAQMSLDGKPCLGEGNKESQRVFLRKGNHKMDAAFQKSAGNDAALSLIWKKPGSSKYEVVPYSAYHR